MDLTEAEDIRKRWQEYTEELYKKELHDQNNHDGMITHLEPDILVCDIKWALESITTNKAGGGADGKIGFAYFLAYMNETFCVVISFWSAGGSDLGVVLHQVANK